MIRIKKSRWAKHFAIGFFTLISVSFTFWLWSQNVIPKYSGNQIDWKNQWRPLFLGVEYTFGDVALPRKLKIHAVRIDLTEPTIKFKVTPSNGSAPGEASSQTTSQFLESQKCQVAINGSMFEPAQRFSGKPMEILGWSVSNGVEYSKIAKNLHSIGIDKDNNISYGRPAVTNSGEVQHGLGGLWMVLQDGELTNDKERKLDPRTIIGSSKDSKYLFLVVIDGRQPGFSEGVHPVEAGRIMKELGAWNALNLDGGGSSTLVVENQIGMGVVVNRPCSPFLKGIQRPVANHFGVIAKEISQTSH